MERGRILMFFSFVLISVFLTFVSACVFALLYTYEGRHLGADHHHCSLPVGCQLAAAQPGAVAVVHPNSPGKTRHQAEVGAR